MNLESHYRKADKLMLWVSYGLVLYSFALAPFYNTWSQAFTIGLGTAAVMTVLYRMIRGSRLYRCVLAAGFMVLTGLHINQGHGMIELHFGVFALLAMLLYYRDWLPIVVAAATIAVHHLAFYWLQTQGLGVWVVTGDYQSWGIIFLHAGYVIVESAILVLMAVNLHREVVTSIALISAAEHLSKDSDNIDLTYRLQGANSQLLTAFNNFLNLLEDVIGQAAETSSFILKKGEGMSGSTSSLLAATEQQSYKSNEISRSVLEMSNTVEVVAKNAQKAADTAKTANENAQVGVKSSSQIRQNMHQLSKVIKESTEKVETLAENSNNIGSVIDVIRGIAEQTNLLALNAAIEAARAGEQGRGFAVVADEVRNLASKTQQSTEEIHSMIEELQAGSNKAVESMMSSYQYVQSCVDNSEETVQSLENVDSSISQINQMNDMIASATQQQSAATQQISNSVNSVKEISDQSLKNVQGAVDSSADIMGAINQLREILVKFSVSSANSNAG